MKEQTATVNVSEKCVTETESLGGSLNESGNVSGNEALLAAR